MVLRRLGHRRKTELGTGGRVGVAPAVLTDRFRTALGDGKKLSHQESRF